MERASTLEGSNQVLTLIGRVKEERKPLSGEPSALCQAELLARDEAGCQGDTPPSSRTVALTNQPIHSCDVSSTGNSDVSVLRGCVRGAGERRSVLLFSRFCS